MISPILFILFCFILVGFWWIVLLVIINKVRSPKVKYDEYYLDITFKSMGYIKSDEDTDDYYKVVDDGITLHYTLSSIGLMASCVLNKEYHSPSALEESTSKFISDEFIEKSCRIYSVTPTLVKICINPEETLDSFILDKIEKILYEIVKIVN